MTFGFGITVEVLETVKDRHGDTTVTVKGTLKCAFAPAGSFENTDQRQQVDRAASLLESPPSDVEVKATDRVRLPDGTVWEVDGAPEQWGHPMSGWRPGREIRIRRVTG